MSFIRSRNYLILLALILALIYFIRPFFESGFHFEVKLAKKNTDTQDTHISLDALEQIIAFYKTIEASEYKVYSQNNEDGVINKIANLLEISKGFYVEFGTQSGIECNTRYLREKFNWKGLLMDGTYSNASINLNKEIITHSNILQLFSKYKIQKTFDLLSEDTDFADYWIVENILKEYTPKIVVHEINKITEGCVTVPKPKEVTFWDETIYNGANICAFQCLAKRFDYTMVYCETTQTNCFWIRNDLLLPLFENVTIKQIQSVLTTRFLTKPLRHFYLPTTRPWTTISC